MSLPTRHSLRSAVVALSLFLVLAVGCTGLLQNLGARWVTRQIAVEFNLDEAQTAATRASVDKLMAAAPAALGSKIDMLVATIDVAIAKGLTEEKLFGMERQVDALLDRLCQQREVNPHLYAPSHQHVPLHADVGANPGQLLR